MTVPGTPTAPAPAPDPIVAAVAEPIRAVLHDAKPRAAESTYRLTIRLDPPELGSVKVHVTSRGDQVRVVLQAETPEARTALTTHRDEIERLLQHEGFGLERFDVRGGPEHHQHQPHRGHGTHTRPRSAPPDPSTSPANPGPTDPADTAGTTADTALRL